MKSTFIFAILVCASISNTTVIRDATAHNGAAEIAYNDCLWSTQKPRLLVRSGSWNCFGNKFTPVWRWRRAMYNDFLCRMDWPVEDNENANHNPLDAINWVTEEKIHLHDCKKGEIISLDDSASANSDDDTLS